ncbi:MAG: hypothetical protein O9327_10980 [Polaromonas sp.]|nr:hypothetical protein [Polaromonas sp.]
MSLTLSLTGLFGRSARTAAPVVNSALSQSEASSQAVRHCLLALRDLVHLRGSEPLEPGRVSVANDLSAILSKIDVQAFSAMRWRVIESYQDQIVVAEYMAMADAKIARHGTENERAAWRAFQSARRPEMLLNLLVSFMSPPNAAGVFIEDRLSEGQTTV